MIYNVPINANNVIERHKQPFRTSGFRFPTKKEVEEILVAVGPDIFDTKNSLVDRFFPTETTYAHEIEMYVMRTQMGEGRGMTLVHQIGSNALPFETRASKLDLAKASWSPMAFKESKTWGEEEMLLLGQWTEEAVSSRIDKQIADHLAWLMERMKTRRDWMVWQVMRTGSIVIDDTDTYNPSGLNYDIDFQISDMVIPVATKFNTKVANVSSVNPIEFFLDMKRAATFKPELNPVLLIVNSSFIEVLADNTHIQYLIDYERGWTATDMRPPRSVYRNAALDMFKRETGLQVELYDGTYVDQSGNVQFWIPNGEMIVINQNTNPLGSFVYTAHVAGVGENGQISLGTGPYIQVDDRSKVDTPRYTILGGFHGLPRLEGYSTRDFSYNRIKWMQYATPAVAAGYWVDFPTLTERQPLGPDLSERL